MSERTQEARGDEDLLEKIITQGLDQMKESPQEKAGSETSVGETSLAPQRENSGEAATPADGKNRRSAVYLYLLILFGAAFLMLLLAYFVQQRSNENTISDLRESMNISREELLDEIVALEKEKGALFEEIDRLNSDLIQWQKRYEEKDGELTFAWISYDDVREELASWYSFWELERYYQAGDYESCAAVLILQGQSQFTYSTPDAAQERYEEILQAVIGASILDEDYYQYPDRYNDLLDAYFSNMDSTR